MREGAALDVFEQMALQEAALTPAEHSVYDIVKAHPDAVLGSTSNELARRYGVSQSAVSRFCKRLGFAGYGDFRMALHQSLTLQRFDGEAEGNNALDYSGCLARLMEATRDVLAGHDAASVIARLHKASNVYVLGVGQSSIPARMLVGRLQEDSVPSHYIEWGYDSEFLHCVTSDDEVVVFSSKNPTFHTSLTTSASLNPEKKPRILLVTHTPRHPDRKLCDDIIVLPTWATLGLPVYLEPQYSMIFFCMLLVEDNARHFSSTRHFSSMQ